MVSFTFEKCSHYHFIIQVHNFSQNAKNGQRNLCPDQEESQGKFFQTFGANPGRYILYDKKLYIILYNFLKTLYILSPSNNSFQLMLFCFKIC